MVTTNPVNLARMDDERRKKASMEKAKAAHLSKQLQLRLQYARLKVDYGWQRQNLNEVENLYFHHSSQKGRLKPPLPRAHAKPAPGPPPISYPAPVHSTPHIVDVNMFQHQKEEQPPPPTPLLPSAPTPGSSFTSSQASTAETHAGPASQASGSGAGSLPSPQASDCTMRPPPDVPAESSTPAPDQVMLSPFAPPPPPHPDALSPSPFAPPPSPFVPSLYTHAAAPPNSGPPPPNPGQYGPPPTAHVIPSAQALPAAYKTFDVATAAGGGGAGAPLTYDSFWSSHSSVGGWRRHMGRGGAAATG